jgi:phosphate acyltransferase
MTADRGAVIALDAHGSDAGPSVIVDGTRAAAADGIGVRVFGDPAGLDGLQGVDGVEVVAAADAIANDDEPVRAVRSRPDASVVRAAADVAEGASQGMVSAGSTGAAMTAALFALRRLQGVQRPALAVQLPVPSRDRPVVFLDVGANAEARPQHLVQFAYLGSAFATVVVGVERPRVALLTVGEEQGKGTPLVVEAASALARADGIDFAGNVEGRDLPAGTVDVVVADGFTGNVALKTMEGTAGEVAGAVRAAARSNPLSALGGVLLRPALRGVRRRLDPDQTGGAMLLGLRGVAVVAHGSSSGDGIANAVRLAARAVRERVVERTGELLESSGATRSALRQGDERDRTGA